MFLGSGSIQKKKKKEKKRKEFGHFHTLFQELKEDIEQFFLGTYGWALTTWSFVELRGKIEN